MGRKQKTIHYLYKTTCKVTGKYYIGIHSTNNLEDGYLGSGKRLRHSIRKYGEENHVKETLEFFDCREALIEAEKKAITGEMLVDVNCMNLMSGGTGGFISVEHQRKRSILGGNARAKRMKDDMELLKSMREIAIKNITAYNNSDNAKYGISFLGKKHSEETKQTMSDVKRGTGVGKENSQFGTMWITNGVENRKIKKDSIIPEGWFKGRK